MTWKPGERAEWVALVNAGAIDPITEEACQPFARDQLLDEARARAGVTGTGAAGFGDEAFIEPLDVLARALEDEADLTIVGRWMARRFLLRLLQVRLQLVDYVNSDPGVLDGPIDRPLFVTGLPRTGTTLLHGVLARDPARRAPRGWELLYPVPPPIDEDGRVALADAELRMLATVVPAMDVIHEYGARLPKECLSAHSFEFRSEEFTTRYRVPTYAAWLDACDMTPAYRYHRVVLQVLQRRRGAARWVLKSPVHLHSLPVVRRVYPDAHIVVTHRDPMTVLGSATSLVANLRWVHSDNVDFAPIARELSARYRASLDRLVDLDGALAGAGVLQHVRYADVVADVTAEMEKLYAAFGLPRTDDAVAGMRAQLAMRPQQQHGVHEYSFADTGLDRGETEEAFARYRAYFDV